MSKFTLQLYKCAAFLTLILILAQPLAGERSCCEGDLWLKWTQDRREAYVIGYTLGYSKGFANACSRAASNVPSSKAPGPESDSVRNCRHEAPDFSKGTQHLVQSITDFYQHYPTSRDIYISEIVDLLGRGQTVDEIHRHEFPAHKSNK